MFHITVMVIPLPCQQLVLNGNAPPHLVRHIYERESSVEVCGKDLFIYFMIQHLVLLEDDMTEMRQPSFHPEKS